jgi:predicted nucleic-acid-binding protein
VSLVALTETMWVLSAVYERDAAELATALEMLLNHKSLIVENSEVATAALDLFRAKPPLGFSDCLLLNLARQAGHLPLGTFNRALAKVEGALKL